MTSKMVSKPLFSLKALKEINLLDELSHENGIQNTDTPDIIAKHFDDERRLHDHTKHGLSVLFHSTD